MIQHAMVHAAEMSGAGLYSFEDKVWDGLTDNIARRIHHGSEHSNIWCFWHLTRCEDITMTLLVAGTPQLLFGDGWFDRMHVPARGTGNAMTDAEMVEFSSRINISMLREYRISVDRRTRDIVQNLESGDIKNMTSPVRLHQVVKEGAVPA